MTDIRMRPQEKQEKIEEPEQVKAAEALESQDQEKKKNNLSVKMAMAEELTKMGIPNSSAHRILNIRSNTN